MTTIEQLISARKKAGAAGDTTAGKILVDKIVKMPRAAIPDQPSVD